jgi:type II secretory pathway pseudopilin PulG
VSQIDAPAGWYIDPDRIETQRYWDGQAWTDDRAPLYPGTGSTPPTMGQPLDATAASTTTSTGRKSGLVIGLVVAVVLLTVGVGVLIALLAVTGRSTPSAVTRKAVDTLVTSDLANASLAMESYFVAHDTYPISTALAISTAAKVITSPGNTVTITTDGTTGYCIAGWGTDSSYSASAPKLYDSRAGGLQPAGKACSQQYDNSFKIP